MHSLRCLVLMCHNNFGISPEEPGSTQMSINGQGRRWHKMDLEMELGVASRETL